MKPATTSSLTNIIQNAAIQLYITIAPKIAKTIQNYIQDAKQQIQDNIVIPKNIL